MERVYRVLAQDAEWYAANFGRNDPATKARWLELAGKYRKKQQQEKSRGR